ncbi:endonuclease NucS [Halalkalicoccus salilacus]|uniref:endonuclease NucS n=1 Tax=Halalkalicoccus salilacus TaxID=3117459 RepID=UPI0038D50EF0
MTTTEEPSPVSLSDPSPEEAHTRLEAAIDRGALVTAFGRCTVEYDGRAASSLGPGDRHLMLKPDGTVLVHTAEGQKPVNWQPPGCTHAVSVDDGRVEIRSLRSNPNEELLVSFERVAHLATFDASAGTDLSVSGTEADLKRRILEEPELIEPGFRPLATERETPAGAVDVYGEDAEGTVMVLELKRRRVGPDAVGQLDRYVGALERELHADVEIRGVLVAPSVTDRARRLLATKGLEFVSLTPAPEG